MYEKIKCTKYIRIQIKCTVHFPIISGITCRKLNLYREQTKSSAFYLNTGFDNIALDVFVCKRECERVRNFPRFGSSAFCDCRRFDHEPLRARFALFCYSRPTPRYFLRQCMFSTRRTRHQSTASLPLILRRPSKACSCAEVVEIAAGIASLLSFL